MSVTQDYVSTTQGSQLTGLSVSMVRQLAQAGKVEAVKISRNWLVKRSSLDDYMAKREAGLIKPGRNKKNSK